MMRVIQRRDIIRSVRERWAVFYKDIPDGYRLAGGTTVGAIRERLAQLDLDTCSVEDVGVAMGSTGWVANDCDECGEDVPVAIRLGREPDYETRWLDLCVTCLGKALGALGRDGGHAVKTGSDRVKKRMEARDHKQKG